MVELYVKIQRPLFKYKKGGVHATLSLSGYFPERNDHYSYTQMRDLTERVRHDWSELSNMQELKIIRKYSAIGRLITLLSSCKRHIERSLSEPCLISEFRIQEYISTVAAFIYFCIFNFVLIQLSVNLYLDFTAAANESRIREFPALFEYFVDHQKYYYLCLCHIFLIVLTGLTTMIATETLYMSYTQHACGLFQIAR